MHSAYPPNNKGFGFMDIYASHLPILANLLRPLDEAGDIAAIEFGCGWYSTPLIQACYGTTIEDNPVWYGQVGKFYPAIELVYSYLKYAECIRPNQYHIAFIDTNPEWQRKEIALAMRGKARTILIHDANDCWESEHKYIQDLVPLWSFAWKTDGLDPATLILSDEDLCFLCPVRTLKTS